jgi:Flp pilus assembly pilin Flp
MADLTKKYSGGNDDNRRAAIYGLVASLIAVAVIGVVTVVL